MSPETKPLPTLVCHRWPVPMAIPTPTGKKNLAGQLEMGVTPNVGNVYCVKENCMMWNPDRAECFDKTQARALSRIADNYIAPHGDQ